MKWVDVNDSQTRGNQICNEVTFCGGEIVSILDKCDRPVNCVCVQGEAKGISHIFTWTQEPGGQWGQRPPQL